MKIYTMNPTIDVVETPVEETNRIIRHLHLEEGKMIPEHKADVLATVVCLEGKIDFTASGEIVQLVPRNFLIMGSNEPHSL